MVPLIYGNDIFFIIPDLIINLKSTFTVIIKINNIIDLFLFIIIILVIGIYFKSTFINGFLFITDIPRIIY